MSKKPRKYKPMSASDWQSIGVIPDPPPATLEQRVEWLEQHVYQNMQGVDGNDIKPHTLWGRVELIYQHFKFTTRTNPGTPPKTELVKADEVKCIGWFRG